MSETQGIRIVRWNPQSNAQLVPLFSQVFRKRVDPGELETKFSRSPFGRAAIAHLALDGDRAVGFYCLLPTPFSMDGKEYWGGHSVDTMVLPEYRRDGIFGKIMRQSIVAAEEEGMDFLYGCGVDAAIPSFLKKGWELMYRMQLLASPAASRSSHHLLKRLGLAPSLGLGALPPANARVEGLSPVQGPELYQWKAELRFSGWREFDSGWAWLRPERDLWVGDLRFKDGTSESAFNRLWQELQAFARRKGFKQVIFQASPSIVDRIALPPGTQRIESWQTLTYRFPHSPDVSRLELVFGDVDAF